MRFGVTLFDLEADPWLYARFHERLSAEGWAANRHAEIEEARSNRGRKR